MSALIRDMTYALRSFRSARVFAATAVLTLALGIGGTTAIFTLMHAVMLKSLPVADPSRLYRIGDGDNCCVQGSPQGRWGFYSFPLFEHLKAETPQFEDITAFQTFVGRMSVRRQGVAEAPRPLRTMYATGSYFKTLGVGAFTGRVFTADDDRAAATPVAVMAYHAWQGLYGGDGSVVGSTLMIEGQAFTVAGIAPPGFFGETLRADPPDLWLPLQHEPLITGADTSLLRQPISAWLRVIGRLRADATIDGMDARLTVFLRQWIRSDAGYPANFMPELERRMSENVITVVPAGAGVGVMKEQYGRSLRILLVVCAMVLLIACANVANLLLARAVARRGQIAVRLALGASRAQIVVEALMESVLLAVGGAVVGLVVAIGAARLLLSLAFAGATTLPIDITPSPLVMAFAVGLALITGVLFGAAPAWFATRTNPIEALRATARSTGDGASFTRTALLVIQATLSVVLVAGSTMLGRSLGNLEGQDFGFESRGRMLVSVGRPSTGVAGDRLTALYRDVEARLARIPGVRSAGLALYNPLTNNWGEGVLVAGKPAPGPGADIGSSWDRVSTRYLQDLGVKLVRGRYFADSDNELSENVAVVNEAFARRFFSTGEDPIDQHFGLNLPENVNTFRIVGIVGDAKFAGFRLDRPARPMFFVPLAQTVTVREPVDAARGDGLALRRRHSAGHQHSAGHTGATRRAHARRGGSQPDRDQHPYARRTGGSVLRPAARRCQPCRPLRRHCAAPRRDRPLRRHGVYRGAPPERDRPADGARRRSRQRDRHGVGRGVQACRHRAGARGAPRRGGRIPAVRTAVRCVLLGSGGAERGRRRAGVFRIRRLRGAGVESSSTGADDRAAHRLERRVDEEVGADLRA